MRETTQTNTSATFRAFQKQAGLPRAPASSCLLSLHRDGQCPGQHLILIVPALWGQLLQGGSDVGHCLCRQVMPLNRALPRTCCSPTGDGPILLAVWGAGGRGVGGGEQQAEPVTSQGCRVGCVCVPRGRQW